MTAPEVKRVALELGLSVFQPERVKDGTLEQWLKERAVDVAVVLAYGRILPPGVLAAPRHGCLNLHASLLPKYRGAAPINWAIVNGERETGISLMQMDEGLDTGPVYVRRTLPIGPEETAGELAARMAELASTVVLEDVPRVLRGELVAEPQDESLASYAPPITREHLELHFENPAQRIADRVRGMAPRPGAFTTLRGKKLKVLSARAVEREAKGPPGSVEVDGTRVFVTTGEGVLEILSAQLEGRTVQPARDLVNGRVFRDGDRLGNA